MSGTIDVLNCKLGDLKLSFDKDNAVEAERAKRAVTKMLRDGFVIFVEVDGKLRRVESFDEEHEAYIITDVPGQTAEPVAAAVPPPAEPEIQTDGDNARGDAGSDRPAERKPGKRGRPPGKPNKQRVPAGTARATAVAPRSGG